ncbi:MAG: transcriptional repressor [Treponema sp.]|nr:transcriptional repressor [Treponema sp.]
MQENYFSQIADSGIRPSAQRIAIYKYLCENHVHPTVDMIYKELSGEYPALSRTTVYNTLKLFADHGLVQTVHIDEDKLRYDANTEPHIHFKCIKCSKIMDIPCSGQLSRINSECCSFLPEGSIARKIQTYIWGICPSCS